MKHFIPIVMYILLTFSCNHNMVQLTENKSKFIEFGQFSVREKPILNREYLVFLAWYIHTYQYVSPEKIMQILPANSLPDGIILSAENNQLLNESKGILRDYILNPQYLNYPLLGLNVQQILELEAWMCDRYNENRLIDLGILKFNTLQMDEDCFVTESYLADQYVGSMAKEKYLNWSDGEFLPVFRLPFDEEFIKIQKNINEFDKLKAYRFTQEDFLWKWDEYYILVKGNQLSLKLHGLVKMGNPLEYNCNSAYESYIISLPKDEIFARTFYPKYDGVRKLKDFSKYPFLEKDLFGHMDFTIIGDGDQHKPIAIKGKLKNRVGNDSNDLKISWMIYNLTLDGKYHP